VKAAETAATRAREALAAAQAAAKSHEAAVATAQEALAAEKTVSAAKDDEVRLQNCQCSVVRCRGGNTSACLSGQQCACPWSTC